MELTIAGVVKESIVDGPGIRYTVFTQGCPHHCPAATTPRPGPLREGRQPPPRRCLRTFKRTLS